MSEAGDRAEPSMTRLAWIRVWLALGGAFVLMGALRSAIGPALLPLSDRVGASAAALSGLGSVQALGATLIVLVSGPLLPRLGRRRLLIASLALMAIGAAGFAVGRTVVVVGAGALLIGLGTGATELGGNTLVGRLFGARSAGPLNVVAGLFGVGAIGGPALLAAVGQRVDVTFGAMAVLAALLAPLLLGMRVIGGESGDRVPRDDAAGPRPRLAWGTLAGIAAVYFFYVGIEASVGTLLALHLEPSRGATFATVATSFFWGALMVGRFVASAFADRLRLRVLVTAALGLGGVALAATAWVAAAPVAYVLAGFFLAPVFPSAMSALLQAYPERSGIATATVLVSASSGAVILIAANGWIVERGSVATLPWQFAALAVPATVLAWVFLGRTERMVRAHRGADAGAGDRAGSDAGS